MAVLPVIPIPPERHTIVSISNALFHGPHRALLENFIHAKSNRMNQKAPKAHFWSHPCITTMIINDQFFGFRIVTSNLRQQ